MVQCYYKNDNNPNLIRSINSGVCVGSGSSAGFFSCCFPWDLCLPNGLCHSTSKNGTESYYTSLCTDQSLQDSACQKACDGRYRTGLKYNSTNELWACCDSSDRSCSTSTNLTFKAPIPDVLLRQTMTIVDFLPTSTSTSMASSRASTSSATTSTSTSGATTADSKNSSGSTGSDSSSSSSLGIGAIVGICVGVIILLVGLAGLLFWMLKRRRQNSSSSSSRVVDGTSSSTLPPKQPLYGELPSYPGVVEKHGVHVVEAPNPHVDGQIRGGGQYSGNRTGVHELHS